MRSYSAVHPTPHWTPLLAYITPLPLHITLSGPCSPAEETSGGCSREVAKLRTAPEDRTGEEVSKKEENCRTYLSLRSHSSLFFVFFPVEVVVEVGWCGVESRALISSFTHTFYRLLLLFLITFGTFIYAIPSAIRAFRTILRHLLIWNNQHPDNAELHNGSSLCCTFSKLHNQLLLHVSILIESWLVQLHLTADHISCDDCISIGHLLKQLLSIAQLDCSWFPFHDWLTVSTAAIFCTSSFHMLPRSSMALDWERSLLDFSCFFGVETRDLWLTALDFYPTKLQFLIYFIAYRRINCP